MAHQLDAAKDLSDRPERPRSEEVDDEDPAVRQGDLDEPWAVSERIQAGGLDVEANDAGRLDIRRERMQAADVGDEPEIDGGRPRTYLGGGAPVCPDRPNRAPRRGQRLGHT